MWGKGGIGIYPESPRPTFHSGSGLTSPWQPTFPLPQKQKHPLPSETPPSRHHTLQLASVWHCWGHTVQRNSVNSVHQKLNPSLKCVRNREAHIYTFLYANLPSYVKKCIFVCYKVPKELCLFLHAMLHIDLVFLQRRK